MHLSFSVNDLMGYGVKERLLDNVPSADLDTAIYNMVYGYRLGVGKLAELVDIPLSTFEKKANPNNRTHRFSPVELLKLQRATYSAGLVQFLAHDLGLVVQGAIPDQAGGDPNQALLQLQTAFQEYLACTIEPLLASKYATNNEIRVASAKAGELHTAIDHAFGVLRARARPAPATET